MANKRISALDDITLVGGTSTAEVNANDILPITDVDDTTGSPNGTTKAVKVSDLMGQAPVQSVAGRTGAVTISNTDVSGLGTASTQDVGTANGNVVQLDATGLPAVDGSQLTNVSGTDSSKLAIANNLSDLNDAATARTNLGLGTAATTASTDYATSTQGALADSAQQPPAEGAFVDGDKTKLDGIEELADVTDATNVEAAGALMDSEVTNLAQVKAFDSADYASATHTHALDDLSDVSVSSPSSQDVVKWTGSQWEAGQVSVDVDTPLNTALRGTTNPHIGAYPNQSFKVIDNPYQSVMVVADESGNLKLLNSLGVNNIAVGFSVVEDGVEPDIEVVSGSETYSVISGDSDTKGANGLPLRQGFNNPDIGANPAPILISGGTIA